TITITRLGVNIMRHSTLEKILKTRFRLIGIETPNRSAILDTFREHNSKSGTPVYIWKEDIGLYRLDISHVKIPQTTSIQQALAYINNNKHQGIFLFMNFSQYMGNIFVEKSLINISQQQKNKHLFIFDQQLDFSECFKGIVLETKKMLQMKLKRAA
ncbi:MAG: hypothetical protein QM479_03320, partial [Pseudomonadota bacterium]